ncbi:NAD-dependent epimerase/dehydratase family protein [Limosilactobacillus caecicola]|uniref:NAD-dependent epimerase/dehydratase family protein n=1 Tax=Limosilactobacillus caecicola TaxID=2941332 RepID=UPI002040A259|nr:NAD-dependent epimerase/dehydratase family protein [Limosilactobacillus caecicola]
MKSVILFGGNGYLGTNFVKEWLAHGPADVHFFVLGRSLQSKKISTHQTNIQVDVTNEQAVLAVLPEQIDYIIDFVGAPSKAPQSFAKLNYEPASVMKKIAEQKNVRAMGFIGGVLGPKRFTKSKKQIIDDLKTSFIPLAYVEPTLVYGAGRQDAMTRNVPMLKILGLFSKRLKPVRVEDVVNNLRTNLLQY